MYNKVSGYLEPGKMCLYDPMLPGSGTYWPIKRTSPGLEKRFSKMKMTNFFCCLDERFFPPESKIMFRSSLNEDEIASSVTRS